MMSNRPPTPLDVLLTVMQRKWEAGDLDAAAALARAAAPYLHSRPAAERPYRNASLRPDSFKDSPRDQPAPHLLTDAQLNRLLDDGGEPDGSGEPEGSGEAGEGSS